MVQDRKVFSGQLRSYLPWVIGQTVGSECLPWKSFRWDHSLKNLSSSETLTAKRRELMSVSCSRPPSTEKRRTETKICHALCDTQYVSFSYDTGYKERYLLYTWDMGTYFLVNITTIYSN